MRSKRNYVKYINAQFILILLQFTNAVSIQNENSTRFAFENVGSYFNNGSTAAGNDTSTTEPSTNVLPTRNSDLPNKNQIVRNSAFVKDTAVKESKDKLLNNATKSIQSDSKKDKETAYIHIYTENPCRNGATLAFTMFGSQCVCKPGFKGIHCQDTDHCFFKPCLNNATCLDHKTRYECACRNGFNGLRCEMRDKCFPNPCRNAGICHVKKGVVQCSCQRGFKGVNCTEVNKCEINPCRNGGNCIQLAKNQFFCKCLPEYNGTFCRKRNRCLVNPCRNGGVCSIDEKKPVCRCPEGFVAEFCQDYVCKPSPCLHGGVCKVVKNGQSWQFQCLCPKNFTGSKCEVSQPCVARPCMHGRCIDATNDPRYSQLSGEYLCLCEKGYTGKNCRKKICDNCHKNAMQWWSLHMQCWFYWEWTDLQTCLWSMFS